MAKAARNQGVNSMLKSGNKETNVGGLVFSVARRSAFPNSASIYAYPVSSHGSLAPGLTSSLGKMNKARTNKITWPDPLVGENWRVPARNQPTHKKPLRTTMIQSFGPLPLITPLHVRSALLVTHFFAKIWCRATLAHDGGTITQFDASVYDKRQADLLGRDV